MDAIELAGKVAPPIVALGGAFMLDDATTARGTELGLDLPSFYGLGRGSVLGEVDTDVVAAALPFIPLEVVRAVVGAARSKMSAADAVQHYLGACRAWGQAHLGTVDELDRLAALLERVVAAGSVASNPLFAGWRAVPLPADDLPGRVAQLLFLAREHRGGPHIVAILASGLTPLEAVVVSGGPDAAALYGWPAPYPDPESLRERHAAAIALTNRLVADAYAGFDDVEAADLLARVAGAQDAAGVAPRD